MAEESSFNKLQQEIILESNSDNWTEAKLEWGLKSIYQEEGRECLCGKFPIKNICVLENIYNKKTLEVGNVCVKKFLGINTGQNIFTAINRCYKDLSASMGKEAFHYMIYQSKIMKASNDCKLTAWDIKFYENTYSKRKLSGKQNKFRVIINKKFLKYTVAKLKNSPIN